MNKQIEATVQNMGENTSPVFAGEGQYNASQKMYAESPKYFAHIIQNLLPPSEKPYSLLDLGAYKGELVGKLREELGEGYKFDTTAVDINKEALDHNDSAEHKVVSPLEKLPLKDHSADVAIMRLVLQWNTPEAQKNIIEELARVVKRFGIIQHVGADSSDPDAWREKMTNLLNGKEIPKLKRAMHFYSSRDEVEGWMKDLEINFQRLKNRKIENGSEVFSERFGLSDEEKLKTKDILGDKDYFDQTTWVVFPK